MAKANSTPAPSSDLLAGKTEEIGERLSEITSMLYTIKIMVHTVVCCQPGSEYALLAIEALAEKAGYLGDRCLGEFFNENYVCGDYDSWRKAGLSDDEGEEAAHG